MLRLEPLGDGKPVPLDKPVLFFGRHPDCDIRLPESTNISRRHCCIAQVDNRWVIRDLGSTNGVRLNGQRIRQEADMKVGDELQIGDTSYAVVIVRRKTL